MQLDLTGKTAVVTGGSSGIGLACARLLLDAGARVAICGRNEERLADAVEQLKDVAAGRLLASACDVLDPERVATFTDAVEARFKGLDMLICNAGQGRVSTFADTSDDDWREEIELKLFSVIHPVRAFLGALKNSPCAAIVCVNSLLARQPEPHMVATAAARASVANLVRSLAVEFAGDGIRVNSLLLGLVDSGQWRRRYAAQATNGESYEEWLSALARQKDIPLGRLGHPQEAAQAIVFLASPWASYITGTALDLSGGLARSV